MAEKDVNPISRNLRNYHAWLDAAERHVADWFAVAQAREPEDSVDHRTLSSVVMTLRRVIEGRRILFYWEKNETKSAEGKSAELTDAEFLALVEAVAPCGEDSMDEDEM